MLDGYIVAGPSAAVQFMLRKFFQCSQRDEFLELFIELFCETFLGQFLLLTLDNSEGLAKVVRELGGVILSGVLHLKGPLLHVELDPLLYGLVLKGLGTD